MRGLGWSPSFGWVPRPSIKRPKVTLKIPKFTVDVKSRRVIILSLFESRFIPASLKYKLERKLHAAEVRLRFNNPKDATQEYIDYDWEMRKSPWPKQHDLSMAFLDLEIDKTSGFVGTVEKHVPIPPRSAMIGNGIRVVFDPESGEEVTRFSVK